MRMRTGLPRIGIVLLALFGGSSSATLSGQSVLTISKSAPASMISGRDLTYTITYGNNGSDNATGVAINDTLPPGTSFVSATEGGSLSSGVVTWNIGGLNAGITQTVSFAVTVLAISGSVDNTSYSIQANGVSPVSGSPVTTTVIPSGHPAAQTTLGNTVQNPNASDAFLFPTPYTDVDLESPALFAGSPLFFSPSEAPSTVLRRPSLCPPRCRSRRGI